LIQQLKFTNFRNVNVAISPASNINLILGQNGSGKSNFLDGIYHLSFANSFKKYSQNNDIYWDKDINFAKIEATIISAEKQILDLNLVFSNDNSQYIKSYIKNDKRTTKKNFISTFPIVLFTPESLDIFTRGPEIRRDQLDDFIISNDRQYFSVLSEYNQVLKNRNKLLLRIRENNASVDELGFWTNKLVDLGSFLCYQRLKNYN
jgi:DNA replication and repair protein RecF